MAEPNWFEISERAIAAFQSDEGPTWSGAMLKALQAVRVDIEAAARADERAKLANELERLADRNTAGGFEVMHHDVRKLIAKLREDGTDG